MKVLKIGIIVVALAAAAAISLLFGSGQGSIPDTPESRTRWMCSACSHVFMLTALDVNTQIQQGPAPAPPLYCQACRAKEAYRAATCSQCETVYFGAGVAGSSGACPKCYPEFEPESDSEEDAPAEPSRRRRPKSA